MVNAASTAIEQILDIDRNDQAIVTPPEHFPVRSVASYPRHMKIAREESAALCLPCARTAGEKDHRIRHFFEHAQCWNAACAGSLRIGTNRNASSTQFVTESARTAGGGSPESYRTPSNPALHFRQYRVCYRPNPAVFGSSVVTIPFSIFTFAVLPLVIGYVQISTNPSSPGIVIEPAG